MDNVLDTIELARESYLSKDGQLTVIYEAYSNWKQNIPFSPVTLVERAEQRECQHKNRYTNMASGAVFCRDCGVKI